MALAVHDLLRSGGFRLARSLLSLRRPSARANAHLLRASGEDLASLTIRDAVPSDIPALAALHVATWNDTYAPLMSGPPVAIRVTQWEEAFAGQHDDWFCMLLARPDAELVGFVKGVFRSDHEIPGELNKLFLCRDYQRLGLGRRLVGTVVERFLDRRVTAMAAYVDPRNPSCGFFEALGGEWLREPDGRVNFSWYVWPDLRALAARCRIA